MGYVTKKAAQRFEEKKAAIYVRVSTQYQVDRASLPVQREELINYAKYALGISDYVIFEDAGYSAKNTDRPDYQQMMTRMRTGEFSYPAITERGGVLSPAGLENRPYQP